jgi:hypothetical protein
MLGMLRLRKLVLEIGGSSRSPPCRCGERWKRSAFRTPPSIVGDLYQTGGPEALEDQQPKPDRVWNRIPDDVALDEPALSPSESAVRFTDTAGYFVSEASVYRLLKAHDLMRPMEIIPRRSMRRERFSTNDKE